MARRIVSAFELLGVRIRYSTLRKPRPSSNRWQRASDEDNWRRQPPARINVLRDDHGEYFEVARRLDARVEVSDIDLRSRHLLLEVQSSRLGEPVNSNFLCGHDERAWFVAAIPEDAGVRSVQQAMDALKPRDVWDAMERYGVPRSERNLRKTDGFVRQGEWFFIPCPEMEVDWNQVVFNEPIRRARGKPHRCEAMFRRDGELVFVSERFPNGLTRDEYDKLPNDVARALNWETARRGAEVFVRGKVEHADHETIDLPFWHKVVMNTETRSRAMANLAFLD